MARATVRLVVLALLALVSQAGTPQAHALVAYECVWQDSTQVCELRVEREAQPIRLARIVPAVIPGDFVFLPASSFSFVLFQRPPPSSSSLRS